MLGFPAQYSAHSESPCCGSTQPTAMPKIDNADPKHPYPGPIHHKKHMGEGSHGYGCNSSFTLILSSIPSFALRPVG